MWTSVLYRISMWWTWYFHKIERQDQILPALKYVCLLSTCDLSLLLSPEAVKDCVPSFLPHRKVAYPVPHVYQQPLGHPGPALYSSVAGCGFSQVFRVPILFVSGQLQTATAAHPHMNLYPQAKSLVQVKQARPSECYGVGLWGLTSQLNQLKMQTKRFFL